MSCDLKESGRCCRTMVTNELCPNEYINLTDATVPGSGCSIDTSVDCFTCSCEPTFCCPLGYVCNGWRGSTTSGGVHDGEWYCQTYNEDALNTYLAPGIIFFVLLLPALYYIRKIGISRGGDCYKVIRPNKLGQVAPDPEPAPR